MANANSRDVLTARSKKSLAAELGISIKTLNKWLERLDPSIKKPLAGRYFTPGQASKILHEFRGI